ncbi:hypothetical protein [Pseudomonas sp. ICMP 561]|uniref:hypothetical protein n=1 Tax=Pseudomonas sp. ICMP 561 TaxID=1718918 RepID=UPI000C086929|nr:hypothetical protein [Pseudomonas sp. ICMP 561]PHN21257.1 hypothetical protein AO242_04575 [Pseudomonas sp. ICMP 561]
MNQDKFHCLGIRHGYEQLGVTTNSLAGYYNSLTDQTITQDIWIIMPKDTEEEKPGAAVLLADKPLEM